MSLTLVTEVQALIRRDFEVVAADQARLNPTDTNPLEQGEFVALDDTEVNKVTSTALPSNLGAVFQVFTERGRSDVQGINKITVIWNPKYEGNTDQHDGAGAAIVVGDNLTVKIVSSKMILAKASTGEQVVAVARSAVAAAGESLRFIFIGPSFLSL